MNRLKKILIELVAFITIVIASLYLLNYDYLLKAVRITYLNGHKTAFLDDYKYFNNRIIEKGSLPQPWNISRNYNQVQPTAQLEKLHQEIGTVAFLIIKQDSIWNESYYENYTKDSKSNSFSMAKSIVTASLGKAIMDGKIKSLDQKVADFFPEFKKGKSANMTLGDLASMASGLDWDESYYDPFSITTRAYFEEDLKSVIVGLKGINEPGKSYKYLSGNTQLLAMCVVKATGKNLANYVSDSFWKPMGAENEAYWQTDSANGIEKAFCCIASNARDFARFGKLYLHNGKWNGKLLLDSSFVAKSVRPRFKEAPQYGYGWWLCNYKNKNVFYMRGHLGQYVIVVPQDELIIVRLGHRDIPSTNGTPHSDDFYTYLDETYKMLSKK
ncbi:serine hydrolase domain-containing protein [Flavobacterium cellulosilyticum]|uniref:Class C beta-lactamase-related serine hydrolase n=1 Tax=Flavobacterium cellulosilyticum TaxID=2541731 RepID=A0A4R5CPX5_9FLAO|nr:serine hydrolase [Flavobacterium cellulosilyticum]TDD99704.1 class C beta-lactamase-related serine hydrolase [Flavobacterium cellulosilyticum]